LDGGDFMPSNIVIRSQDDDQMLYTRDIAARLARVSVSFWCTCEQEGLVSARWMTGGSKGYRREDIEKMVVIQRLHEQLELDIQSLEVVLHMRQRILDLLDEMEEVERLALQRERVLLQQVQELRRQFAREAR
jgi:DNA-binding transcriptional MerR regulator